MTTTPAVDERVAVTRRPASYEEYLAWSSETRFAEWVGGEMIEYMPPLPDYQRRLMLQELTIPAPEPPQPIEGYGLPDTPQLDWAFVSERMAAAQYYWINTADTDDPSAPQPHTAPLWGIWHGDRIHFDGSPRTRWARNLIAHPAIAVHPPDAENVVIIEGVARQLADDELSAAEWAELDGLYAAKYGMEGSPHWVVEPRLVLAWQGINLGTMTRWRFD